MRTTVVHVRRSYFEMFQLSIFSTSILLLLAAIHQQSCSAFDTEAFEDIVFLNRSKFVSNFCENSCDGDLKDHCQRGCRFFDSILSSMSAFNDTAASISCNISCSEAYEGQRLLKRECTSGCDQAEKNFMKMYELSVNILDGAHKKIGFLQSLFDWSTSILWPGTDPLPSSPCGAPKELAAKKGNDKKNSYYPPKNWNAKKVIDTEGYRTYMVNGIAAESSISMGNANDYSSVEKSDGKMHETRGWVYYTSYILLTVGTLSLIFITGYYIMAIRKYKEITKELADDSEPPSYENVIKEGSYVIEDCHFATPPPPSEETIFLPATTDAPPAYTDSPQKV